MSGGTFMALTLSQLFMAASNQHKTDQGSWVLE